MTHHYSDVVQVVEVHAALEKIKEDSGRWNKSLATQRREQEEGMKDFVLGGESPKSPPAKKNSLEA